MSDCHYSTIIIYYCKYPFLRNFLIFAFHRILINIVSKIQIKQAFKIEYPIRKTKDQVVDDLTWQIIHRAAHRISLGAELFEEMISSYDGSMERKRPPRICNKK